MPAGLQVFNEMGTYQIDGTFKGFVLARKVTVQSSVLVQGDTTDGSFSRATFPINSGEIVALASNIPSGIEGTFNGQMTVAMHGPVGSTLTAYIFSAITSPGGNLGLQVYSPTGEIVFCSMRKPLSFVGFPQGEGNFTYQQGRTYAAICLNQALIINDQIQGSGSVTYYFRVVGVSRGLITSIANGIQISKPVIYSKVTQVNNSESSSQPPSQATSSNAPNFHAIIDVTNY